MQMLMGVYMSRCDAYRKHPLCLGGKLSSEICGVDATCHRPLEKATPGKRKLAVAVDEGGYLMRRQKRRILTDGGEMEANSQIRSILEPSDRGVKGRPDGNNRTASYNSLPVATQDPTGDPFGQPVVIGVYDQNAPRRAVPPRSRGARAISVAGRASTSSGNLRIDRSLLPTVNISVPIFLTTGHDDSVDMPRLRGK